MRDQAAATTTQPADALPPLAERLYPDELARKEADLITQRRASHQSPAKSAAAVGSRETVRQAIGLAFSGGGIRSATFCLGVVQYLAQCRLLHKFDILSTVSGGGYVGGFLGKLIQESKSVPAAEDHLQDSQSWPVNWLRENGYYLAPGGGADKWVILALLLRNWLAVQFVVGGTVIMAFLLSAAARRCLWNWNAWRDWELDYFLNFSAGHFAVSPWVILVAFCFAIGLVLPGLSYWLTQFIPDERMRDEWQSALTRFTGFGLLATCGAGLIAAIDTGAVATYHWLWESGHSPGGLAAIYAGCVAGFGVVQKFAGKLSKLTKLVSKGQAPVPVTMIASLAGYVWALLFLFALALIGQWLVFSGEQIPDTSFALESLGEGCLAFVGLTGIYIVAAWVLAQVYGFVNLSSLHQYYSSRLCRAYLGASNRERKENVIPVTQPHPSDNLFWDQYAPQSCGGPLHILNCTLNETVSGKSQIERMDRKGLAFALGPEGLSVGSEHHALWGGPADHDEHHRKIVPIDNTKSFQVFPVQIHGEGPAASYSVENLTLGDWIGVSGAAFSTGMGANTNSGLSLLLGFANIRLGYWWDSGIKPGYREQASPAPASEAETRESVSPEKSPLQNTQRRSRAGQLLNRLFAKLFPAPSSLLDELLTEFHGPARRRWYLSDGGHFENTACYELLRRQVRFILCLDCGQDEDYVFEDIANLVRKARIDFDAEVRFLEGNELLDAIQSLPAPFNELDPKLVGLPKDFHHSAAEKRSSITTTGSRHALLARVLFHGSGESPSARERVVSHILFLKPSLSGDEQEDVAEYHASQVAFPQESTADQFFDESQWESYRALGWHVARNVLNCAETAPTANAARPKVAKAKRKSSKA